MKYFLLFSTIFISMFSFCQKKGDNYNTTINKADKVEINDGVINIKKADSVIIRITIIQKKTFIYLDSIIEKYDASRKVYVTNYFLSNKQQSLSIEFDLTFIFESPIVKCELLPNGSGSANMSSMSGTKGSKSYYYFTGKITCANGIVASVESKEKIKITIKGIDGAFTN
jgi:hypothetical protein